MKGNRTVNTQKLMKKLLALPVLETTDGKRAIELSRALEAVRASSIAEKEKPSIPEELEGICLRCGKKIDEEEKAFLDKDNPGLCMSCAYGLNTEKSLTTYEVIKAVNLLNSSAEKARFPAGRYCYNCRHARLEFGKNMMWAIYCAKLNEFHNKGFNCHMWERRIYHE